MDAFFAIAETLRALIHLRYMFAGLVAGAIFGQIYKKFDPGAGDDAVFWTVVVFAVVGLILDIRRGLKS